MNQDWDIAEAFYSLRKKGEGKEEKKGHQQDEEWTPHTHTTHPTLTLTSIRGTL